MCLLKEKLYYGTATRADITRITRRLGDEIGKVYGWDFPQLPDVAAGDLLVAHAPPRPEAQVGNNKDGLGETR